MNRPVRIQARQTRGFTLIEVVIAVSLTALIMLGLVTAMRSLGVTTERVSEVSLRADEMQMVTDFLRRAFSSTDNLTLAVQDAESGNPSRTMPQPYFSGEADRVRWGGLLPARHGGGGVQLFELALSSKQKGALVLRYVPYSVIADWSKHSEHVLLTGVEQFEISYQGADSGADWVPVWKMVQGERFELPSRLRIRLQVNGRYWPEGIYALNPL